MHRIGPVVVVLALLLPPTAGWAQKQGYGVSAGLLTVSSTAGLDALSRPDFQVRIWRKDPDIEAKVGRLDDRITELDNEADRLLERKGPLQRKRQQSEIEPGPPLTAAERERLAELSALPLAEAQAPQIEELRRLQTKEEASERQPGPALTAAEEAELQSLAARRDGALGELANTRRERSGAYALIYGATRTVSSNSRIVEFGSGPVLTVHEGDVLRITVVDEDMFVDDVLGTHSLIVTSEILERGAVELGRSASVRSLNLHFRPTAR